MSRLLSLLVSAMLLLTLGLAQAPRVCVGDGNGGACRPEACACVAACSCQAAHHRDMAARAEVSDCCAVAEPASCHAAPATEASACHGPGQWPHFAPSDRHWFALVPAWPVIVLDAPVALDPLPLRERAAHHPQAPPERPPRLLG
jgi:hypothetical protein